MITALAMMAVIMPTLPAGARDMGKVGEYQTISAGDQGYTAAIKEDGSLWTWGDNRCGQLGDGTIENKYTPIKIMDNVVAASAGCDHTAVIKEDGSLWIWGWNEDGQLGDGTTENKTTPVKIMDNVAAVSMGFSHTAAIKEDGSLWTWGENIFGQLGDGTTYLSNPIPTKVMEGVRLPGGNVNLTPSTSAPAPSTPQPSESTLKIYSNEPTLSTAAGNSFLIGASIKNDDGSTGDLSGLSVTVEDGSVVGTGGSDTRDGVVYYQMTAKKEGITQIKISDSKTGQSAALDFAVNRQVGNAYTLNTVPKSSGSGDDANFYKFSGLYIDNFDYDRNGGDASVSFDAYSENYTYGTVESYNADGSLHDVRVIDKFWLETSISDIWNEIVEIGKDMKEDIGLWDYRSYINTKETTVENLVVPKGGYIKITPNTRESGICSLINALDMIGQIADAVPDSNKSEVASTAAEKVKKEDKTLLETYCSALTKKITGKNAKGEANTKAFINVLREMFSMGTLRDFAVSTFTDSAIGTAKSVAEDLFVEKTGPFGKALDVFFAGTKYALLATQSEFFIRKMNAGSIIIHNPDGDKRVCSDVTVECEMSDDTAFDVYMIDKNDPAILEARKNNPRRFKDATHLRAFEMNLVENGRIIRPNGKTKVTIALPEGLIGYTGDITVYRVEDDGSLTNMNAFANGTSIVFETDHFSTYILTATGGEAEKPETEEGQVVVENNTIVSEWAAEEVQEAFDEEIVPEVLKGEDLTKQVDRAEFAAIAVNLYEKLSGKTAVGTENPFGDISGNACESDILKAYNLNITAGTSDITFDPGTLISREQVATMLCRAYKKSEFPGWSLATDANYPLNFMGVEKFADDAEISDYAKESVYFMARWDIIAGVGDNKFAPKNSVELGESYGYATREQAVVIALRSAKHL